MSKITVIVALILNNCSILVPIFDMKIFINIAIFGLILLLSCSVDKGNKQSKLSKDKLSALHSGFNKRELTKEYITSSRDSVVIVAFGHVYGLLNHPDVFDLLIDKVNEQDPDYVWILGDVVYNNTEEEWAVLFEKYKGMNGERFHAGGNHDMNYHYERYHGSKENQWEAESRYLDKIGYRYLTLEDELANYMLINMNDSLDRISEYLDRMLPQLNPVKQSILFTHHATWHPNQSKVDDPKTWVKKNFPRDSLLPKLVDFDYMIYGDWSEGFYFNSIKLNDHKYKVIDTGNLKEGDPLHITRIVVRSDGVEARPVSIPIPLESNWYKKSPH